MLKLQFLRQPEQYTKLAPPSVTIGRDPKNQLVVDDESVSDFHAEINLEGSEFVIIDLLSSSGTFVNGKSVSGRTALGAWDVIRVGNVELEINDPNTQRPNEWALKAKSDLLASQYFPLSATTIVGRESGCDLHIESNHLSRQHARLVIEDDQLRITDLDSRNGTFLNDERITEALAKPGDEISFDRQTFVITGPVKVEQTEIVEADQTVLRDEVHEEAEETLIHNEDVDATLLVAEEATRIVGQAEAPKAALIEQGERSIHGRIDLQGSLLIGRSDASDLVLADTGVSKQHATVSLENTQWVLEDAGSSNGVFINGQREQRSTLRDGDLIRIGAFEFRFELAQAATEIMDMEGTVVFSGSHTPPPIKKAPQQSTEKKPAAQTQKSKKTGSDSAGMPAWLMGGIVFALCVAAAVLIYMRRSGAL